MQKRHLAALAKRFQEGESMGGRYLRRRGSAAPLWALLAVCIALLPSSAHAHLMSMSGGELRVEGTQARYELHMPLYEVAHLDKPETTLLESFLVYAGDQPIQPHKGKCSEDRSAGDYRCEVFYDFTMPPDEITVECRFAAVTVPNHIHVLRAIRGDLVKQAVFDFSLRRSTIRFSPLSWRERAASQMWTGVVRVVTGPFQVLFLAALVLAGRQRRELVSLALAFALSQTVAAVLVPLGNWSPPVRFVEAAAALTVAYLAVEILVLPNARHRWIVAGGMGVFHGLYFASFLAQSGMEPIYVLGGVLLADAFLLLLLAYLFLRIQKGAAWLQPIRSGAILLLVIGLAWFAMRLRS